LLKKQQQKTIFSQKSKKHTFWPAKTGQGGGTRAPLAPSPPDAHAKKLFLILDCLGVQRR
jgi:hypothetical protein